MKTPLKTLATLIICGGVLAALFYLDNQRKHALDSTPPVSQPQPESQPAPIIPTPDEPKAGVAPEKSTSEPLPDPLEWVQQNWRGRIRSVTITQQQTVPVYADSIQVGTALLPLNRVVPLTSITQESVTVSFMDHAYTLPIHATDLEARATAALHTVMQASKAPQPAAKQTPTTHKNRPSTIVDTIAFGNQQSERSHAFQSEQSQILNGGLNQTARELLPLQPNTWKGGTMQFTLKIDPESTNYLSLKLWGNDINDNRLVLFAEGKQVGYLHLGDIDLLDNGTHAPFYTDRFYYTTNPLPLSMTKGKTELQLEIHSHGHIWAYGREFERYQRTMEQSTRGIYAAYTHTDGFFEPLPTETQGNAPENPALRSGPNREVLDQVKERVNGRLRGLLTKETPNQTELQFMANAYWVDWTDAYKERSVVQSVLRGGDAIYQQYTNDPDIATSDKTTHNPDWFGLGPLGEAIWRFKDKLDQSDWDQDITDGKTRREAWTEMFTYSRDWNMRSRRQYTNQAMIKDLYGIYLTNKGLSVFNPGAAIPESQTLGYLHESVGIKPWLGPIGIDGRPTKPLGENYYQLTKKGLTKELGYVGNYGEVLDWVADIYDATRPAQGAPGDPLIREQLIKMTRARSYFRYPALDADGKRAMRLETVVGWRDHKFPGDIIYAQRPSWDASALEVATAVQDPYSVGYAQQMFDENQFFASVEHQLESTNLRATAGILHIPDQYETIRKLPESSERLPMSPSQPDFVFTDEEVGVVALKNGKDILYISLYWRARNAVNFLARVHYMTPQIQRVAVVKEDVEFKRSDMSYTRRNWIDFGFGNGGHKYPDQWDSAHEGETLPIARIPDGITFRPGDENVYAGRGDFYTLHYGPYLIGMNCSEERTFDLEMPEALITKQVKNLVTGESLTAFGKLPVKPHSTVVLYRP